MENPLNKFTIPALPAFPLKFFNFSNPKGVLISVLATSIVLGALSGYLLSNNKAPAVPIVEKPKTAQQDTRTFRDFAEGMIQKRPASKNPEEYVEGTHVLVRDGAVPVALTSSVIDLSEYEGKQVKVLGETQKAIKEGWLMDVGKVEVK